MTEPLFVSDADPIDAALGELRQIPRYPFADEIDRPFVRRFVEDHPTLDVALEIRKWAAWLTEHPEITRPKRKKTNYRARLLTWITRASTYHGATSGRTGPATSAASPEAYGATSEALERW